MAGRSFELRKDQGHTYQRSFEEAHGTDWVGMAGEIAQPGEEHPRDIGWNKSRRWARGAELSALIVHQLKEPLTAMLANALAARRWLANEPPNLMEAVASIDGLARDIRAADETMERIRAMFEPEPLDKKKTSVHAMVNEAVRLVLEDPSKRKVTIKSHIHKTLPKVYVDPLAIEEILINLISDAVEVLASSRNSPLLTIQAFVNDENEMIVQMIDNGPGIDETEGIFDVFLTPKTPRLGISLAVSRLIAEAHGGRLWAENNPDGGARFSVALPLFSVNKDLIEA
jgi:C4-dicarboxylate-specific signal transduction histidine kinase